MTGLGVFADGQTGGELDGQPYDTRVDLGSRIRTFGAYASDTLSIGSRWHLSFSGRLNRTTVRNRDRLLPGAVSGSLDGDHTYVRFNPAAGLTMTPWPRVNAYVGYSEGSRAPASIELGCADPDAPCKLPNAMAGDPPLEQVVTRTIEAGVRNAGEGRVIIDMSDSQVGIDIRKQGRNIIVDFQNASLPANLAKRYDVQDFGTPVQIMEATHFPMLLQPEATASLLMDIH